MSPVTILQGGLIQPDLLGWWVGFIVGALVVAVAAALLLVIIATANNIADTAEDITRGLAQARDRTEGLWQVHDTKQTATDILNHATAARQSLAGEP